MFRSPTRRQLLVGLSGAAACAATEAPAGPLRPDPVWTLGGVEDETSFPGGLRAGDPTAEGWVVSARTRLPEVTLVVAVRRGDGWSALPPWTGIAAVEGFVRVEVDGLDADTEHLVVYTSPDGTVHSAPGLYRTLPAADRPVVFGATSCLGGDNPTFPGLAAAALEGLDLFVFAGDAIYTRARTVDAYRAEYEALRATSSVRALTDATPIVAVWDDHEVANDWALDPHGDQTGVTTAQVAAATTTFREALPQRVGAAGTGFWRTVTVGTTLELILLDCRGEREAGRMLSEAQLDWAIATLRASRCAFKVVVSSSHLTDHGTRMSFPDDDGDVGKRWQGFPDQRGRLVAVLDEVPGVVVLTGDMHYGGIQRVGADGDPGAERLEVAVGPSGSEAWDVRAWLANLGADDAPYLDLVPTWSWARFVADQVAGTLVVELVGDDGLVRASRTLLG